MAQTHQPSATPGARPRGARPARDEAAARQPKGNQGNDTGAHDGQQRQGQHGTLNIPVIAMRGLGRMVDIHAAAARLMLQTQASAASAFGWPDYSGFFRIADERMRRVFSSGTEQLLTLAEQASETSTEVQRQVARMLESQAAQEAENWQRGLEELGLQAEESLNEFKSLAQQQAEESIRAAEMLSEESREALRESGEQLQQSLRQGIARGQEAVSRASGGDSGRHFAAPAEAPEEEEAAEEEEEEEAPVQGRRGGSEGSRRGRTARSGDDDDDTSYGEGSESEGGEMIHNGNGNGRGNRTGSRSGVGRGRGM